LPNVNDHTETDKLAKKKPTAETPPAQAKPTSGPSPKNKMDAVRMALKDRGKKAKPLELQSHIREKYSIDMSRDHISTYKGQILNKAKGAKKASAAKPQAAASQVTNGAAPRPIRAVSLADQVAKLKEVAAAIGKDEAKKIIDLL
jgi:hypothetical protein